MKEDGTTASYTYSPDSLRVSKTVNGETTTHVLDGANVVADVTAEGIAKYNRGRELISMEQNGQKGYYVFNGHGDVVQMRSASGEQVYGKRYDAFGVEIFDYEDTNQFANPFGYAGEYTDEESGNIYLRARYYNPSTGRFLSEDPIMDGTNWYIYAGNNPVLYVDPWGLAAYDPFDSYYDAALDWAEEYGAVTQYTENELYSMLYSYTDENGDTKYSYTKPFVGLKNYSDPELARYMLGDIPSEQLASMQSENVSIHSHNNNSTFSIGDKNSMKNGELAFVAGPDGTVAVRFQQEYVVATKNSDGTETFEAKTRWVEKAITKRGQTNPIAVKFDPLSVEEQKALYAYLINEVNLRNQNIPWEWTWPHTDISTQGWTSDMDTTILHERFTVIPRDQVQRN